VIVNIERYGNTTAGTIPLAMNTAIEEGKLKKGKPGADGLRGRGLHSGRRAAALGF
jgi:3-oxoacyl-[acyl-carrier-protein] synthase III